MLFRSQVREVDTGGDYQALLAEVKTHIRSTQYAALRAVIISASSATPKEWIDNLKLDFEQENMPIDCQIKEMRSTAAAAAHL